MIEEFSIKGEPCYRIQYEPKRSDVLAFRGFLYISKESFAVVKATLRSTKKMNVNFVNGVVTDLEFDNPDDETFLPSRIYTEFDLALTSKKKNAKGIVAKRTVNYTNYEFNHTIAPEVFDKKAYRSPDIKSLAKTEDFWEKARVDSLSSAEQGIYEMLDKLQEVPRFNNMVKLYETLASGYYNVGKAIDIGDLYSTFGFNDVEGTRVRLGARTFFRKMTLGEFKAMVPMVLRTISLNMVPKPK